MAAVVSAGELRDLSAPYGRPTGGYSALTIADPGVPLDAYSVDDPANDPTRIWKTQPSVRKVVDFVARNIASVSLHTYERVSDTDRGRVTDGPIAGTLGAPRARVTPFRFWHGVIVDWLLFDRWCAIKVPSADRRDGGVDLVRIPARRFSIKGDALGEVTGIKIAGREKLLDPASCLYDFGYTGTGEVGGTTPMQSLSHILSESREAIDWRRKMWKRGARIPAVIERPKDAGDWTTVRPGSTVSARDRFVQGWSNFTRGGGSEGGTPILEDGMTLKENRAFRPIDVQDAEFRQLTDAEVAAAFHIAPELVGARQGNYSNVKAYREMLYGDALGGYYVPLEQVVNTMLVPDLDSTGLTYVEYNIDGKLRGSFEEQAAVLSTATGRPFMTSAEARGRLNLRDLGGDTDQIVTPLNVTVGGLASPRDTAPE